MTQKYPLKRKYCLHCGEMFYGKSARAKWCGAVCQSRNWRATQKKTQAELALEFAAQQEAQTNMQEAA